MIGATIVIFLFAILYTAGWFSILEGETTSFKIVATSWLLVFVFGFVLLFVGV